MIRLVQRDLLSCEAIVRRMSDGRLIMVSQCGDVTEPAPKNRVYVWYSEDDGDTWSDRKLLLPDDGRAVYQTEVTVTGDLIEVYVTTHNGKFSGYRCFTVWSDDCGASWHEGEEFPVEGFTFVRGRIDDGKGGYILPYQNYPQSKEEAELFARTGKMIWDASTPHVVNGVLLSKDGKKWVKGGENRITFDYNESGKRIWVWSEPTLARLSDGTIVMLMRVDHTGCLWRSESKDGGLSWSEPVRTDILNPANKPKLINLDDGRIALINTHDPVYGMKHRFPLELWISDDDMKTWSVKRTLSDFPGWYSYPDGFVEDGKLYLAFEFNRHDVYFLKTEL